MVRIAQKHKTSQHHHPTSSSISRTSTLTLLITRPSHTTRRAHYNMWCPVLMRRRLTHRHPLRVHRRHRICLSLLRGRRLIVSHLLLLTPLSHMRLSRRRNNRTICDHRLHDIRGQFLCILTDFAAIVVVAVYAGPYEEREV